MFDCKCTISEFIDRYELERELASGTVSQYRWAAKSIEKFARSTKPFSENPFTIGGLCDEIVNRWLKFLSEKNSPATVRCRRNHLLALWREAAAQGIAAWPQRVRRVGIPRIAPLAWNVDEVRGLLAATRCLYGTYQSINGIHRSQFWNLAIRLAWDTGLRQGDVLRIRFGDISPSGLVVVTQNKTGQLAIRQLKPSTMLAIELLNYQTGYVAPWPYTRNWFQNQFGLIVQAAKMRGSFKKLRKSASSNVESKQRGRGIELLGHAPGSKIGPIHYFDPRIIMPDTVGPEEL